MKDDLGWIEAVLEEEVLRENYSIIIGKVICAEINDAFADDGSFREFAAVMLRPDFRIIGESIGRV